MSRCRKARSSVSGTISSDTTWAAGVFYVSNNLTVNADVTLTLGSATNVPFTGNVFSPRVWNGTVRYDVVPEPATLGLLVLGGLALLRRR